MKKDDLSNEIRELLDKKTIHDILRLTRALNIRHKANEKKDGLIELLMGFAQATLDPTPRSARGAHPKSNEYDKELADAILRCRDIYLEDLRGESLSGEQRVCDSAIDDGGEFKGVLERGSKYYYINNMLVSGEKSVYVGSTYIEKYNLKAGDLIAGRAVDSNRSGLRIIESVASVNGILPDMVGRRGDFESFKVIQPDKQLKVAAGADDICGREIDLLAPLGAGQRSLVLTTPWTDNAALIKNIAFGIKANQPECKIILLAAGAFPEEIAEFKELSSAAELFCTEFTDASSVHADFARMAVENAVRTAESKSDVVLLVYRLESLIGACRTLERNPEAPAEDCPYVVRRLFNIARNTEENASLTMLATINGRCNPMLFNGANMRVALECGTQSVNSAPSIDVLQSYSARSEKFTSGQAANAAKNLRSMVANGMKNGEIADIFRNAESNSKVVEEYGN